MKWFVKLVSVAWMVGASLHPVSGQEGKVLLVAKEGTSADLDYMITHEMEVMTRMLEGAGFEVVVASPTGAPQSGETLTFTPDLRLSDVRMADFAGIIMPCMAMEVEAEVPELLALIREAVDAGKPVAAQLGSVVQLARAGVMEGKRFAYVEEWVADVPELEGLQYGGPGVVVEGNVITSGVCPWAAQAQGYADTTPALTKAFLNQLQG